MAASRISRSGRPGSSAPLECPRTFGRNKTYPAEIVEHDTLKHSSHPPGSGHLYVQENVSRALRELMDPVNPWRDRILSACQLVRRSHDEEFFTYYMSDSTLAAWRDCDSGRFNKEEANLTEEEILELAGALRCYLRGASVDEGIRLAGQDPRQFDEIGLIIRRDQGISRPHRNA